jgi:hypothetical protein
MFRIFVIYDIIVCIEDIQMVCQYLVRSLDCNNGQISQQLLRQLIFLAEPLKEFATGTVPLAPTNICCPVKAFKTTTYISQLTTN